MPYKLRKAPKRDLYWVVTIATGKKHSKEPIPLEKAKGQMRILESAGGVHGVLDPITKHFNAYKPSFGKQKKTYFQEKVGNKNKELDASKGFEIVKSITSSDDPLGGFDRPSDEYKINILKSPNEPDVELMQYTLNAPNAIGHRIVFKKVGGEYEYYNSTGEAFEDLPYAVRIVAPTPLKGYENPKHQGDAPLCERHSLSRACFKGTNAEYDVWIQEQTRKTGKTPDEYIWDESGGRKYSSNVKMRGGMYALNPSALPKKKPSLRSRIESVFNPTYGQRIEALQKKAEKEKNAEMYRRHVEESKSKSGVNARDVATGCSAGMLGCFGLGKKKMRGGNYDGLKTLKILAGSAGTTNRKLLQTINAYGYAQLFNQGNALPPDNLEFFGRAFQDRVMIAIQALAYLERDAGIITEEEFQDLRPRREATREEVRDFVRSHSGHPPPPPPGGQPHQVGGRRKRRGGADDDVDLELAALMGALPMPAEERPAAPAPKRPVRHGRIGLFEEAPVRFAPAPPGPRRGVKRSHARMQTGRGGALRNTNIAMSLFPSIRSATTLKQAVDFYRGILSEKEKSELNHFVSLVTNKHWRNFADVPSLGEMNHIIDLILKHGELRADAPAWRPTVPKPSDEELAASMREKWESFGGAKCKKCGLTPR